MPGGQETPRDLLFGLLALQTGLIDEATLIAAFQAWSRSKGRAIAEILVERGAVDADQRSLLDGLALQLLRRNGGDPETSLASVAGSPATLEKPRWRP
jgi:hypothetical protein